MPRETAEDLLALNDNELLQNFDLLDDYQNLLIDTIKVEGDELNIDMNINIDVPSYLNDISMQDQVLERKSQKFQPKRLEKSIETLSNYIASTASENIGKLAERQEEDKQQDLCKGLLEEEEALSSESSGASDYPSDEDDPSMLFNISKHDRSVA